MIDVKQILVELGVDYKESGKNVGSNDINVDCPFCNSSKHLGISIKSGFTFCWVCEFNDLDRHPTLLKVLIELTGLHWAEVKEAMIEHGWEPFNISAEELSGGLSAKASLPKEYISIVKMMFYKQPSDEALQYLSERMFDMDTVRRYKLGVCTEGVYANRIIIPIFFNGNLASFTSRSYKREGRYKHAPLFMSSERIKNLLYNYDVAKNYSHVYLLEGATDVWRMGKNAMAVFRSKLSRNQRNILMRLSNKRLTSITVIFDFGATSRAYEAAEDLSPFISKIKVVSLPDKRDVADRTRNQIIKLEKETPYYRG